jgi:hypothetical protein
MTRERIWETIRKGYEVAREELKKSAEEVDKGTERVYATAAKVAGVGAIAWFSAEVAYAMGLTGSLVVGTAIGGFGVLILGAGMASAMMLLKGAEKLSAKLSGWIKSKITGVRSVEKGTPEWEEVQREIAAAC